MKIKQILVAFLFTALVISCGNKAKDIDVSELTNKAKDIDVSELTKKAKDIDVSELTKECDVVDAMEIVIDEVIALGEAVDSEEGASEEQKEEFKSLGEKAQEIGEQSDELGFKESDLEDCPSFEILEKKIKKTRKLRKFFR